MPGLRLLPRLRLPNMPEELDWARSSVAQPAAARRNASE
jgi:hypothetical protein